MRYRIKPLEWKEQGSDSIEQIVAATPWGNYTLLRTAYAAAQAHWESLLMQCLEEENN